LKNIEIQEGKKLRIEIDEQLEKMLDEIKRKKWITGKGHTETVRFLAQRYQEFESISHLINQKFSDLDERIQNSILAAFKTVITNILKPSD
jgi:hypothetical protein